jgi:hypothetical protein
VKLGMLWSLELFASLKIAADTAKRFDEKDILMGGLNELTTWLNLAREDRLDDLLQRIDDADYIVHGKGRKMKPLDLITSNPKKMKNDLDALMRSKNWDISYIR